MTCTNKIAIKINGKIYYFPCGKCLWCLDKKRKMNKRGFK